MIQIDVSNSQLIAHNPMFQRIPNPPLESSCSQTHFTQNEYVLNPIEQLLIHFTE